MIGYRQHVVIRMSVCLNAEHCGSQGRCTGLKVVRLYQRVPIAGMFLFVRSATFAVGCIMYRLATKRTGKDESKKTRT